MSRCRWVWIVTSVLAGVMILSGTVLAAWNIREYCVNFLTMSSYKNTIVEEYKEPDHVEPGQKVLKKVSVRNEGDVDTFVRVKIEKFFGIPGEDEDFLEDGSLDPEMIEIHYNSDYWKLCPDGYWYYTDVLQAGEITKEPLLKSYRLSEKVQNSYKNKEAQIVVHMESIQAAGGTMEALWGMKEKDLGIIYQPCTCETVAQVIITEDRKIAFEAEEDNLFSGFQNLLPGCSRTQTVNLTNKSDATVNLMLRAEAAEQDKMSSEQQVLVHQLISKYAVMEIRQGNTVLYQGPADGNQEEKGWSMKQNISLGTFQPGETKRLVVTLSLDPQMDNRYQKLKGKVNWIFTAEGTEASENRGDEKSDGETLNGGGSNKKSTASEKKTTVGVLSPKTGDSTDIFPELILMIGGLVCAVVSYRKIYGRKRS